jgi:hypothetical protein
MTFFIFKTLKKKFVFKSFLWIRIELKCWIRIRIRIGFNLDPQPWFCLQTIEICTTNRYRYRIW